MSFLISDKQLLKRYNEIWNKVNNIIQKRFDNKPVYDNKCVRTKIKYYDSKCRINFHRKGIPPEYDTEYICLSIRLIDSVFRIDKNYYPEVFLEDCKCVVELVKTY